MYRRSLSCLLSLFLTFFLAGGAARVTNAAPALAPDDIDDPKVARRLKTRAAKGAVTTRRAPSRATQPQVTAAPLPRAVALADAVPPPPPDAAVVRQSDQPPAARDDRKGRVPHLKLGYRRFNFVRIGAAANPGVVGTGSASESFDSLSLDFYPLSWFVRFGLSTQYGWESGTFNSGGDYLIAQSATLGFQLPGKTVTPFAEALAGAGYMRRVQFDRTIPTVYWQLGVDVGAEFFVTPLLYLSAAVGYLHPVNGFAMGQSFASVYVDTWSLKLGVGF
jgi:hypothetical protein